MKVETNATTVSRDPVLYTIHASDLDTGLRDFPVSFCPTSRVDPMKGLFYVDHPISELSSWSPERVIYLIFYGEDPTEEQLSVFQENLRERAHCNPEFLAVIRQLPRDPHPMRLFTIALELMTTYEGKEGKNDYKNDALNAIAKVPEIVAAIINHHAGWGESNPSKPELGYIENFVQMLRLPPEAEKTKPLLVQTLRLFYNLHCDHGGGNLSTFVAKATASGLQDVYGSLASGMLALEGPRHGRANQDALEFVQLLLQELGENATEDQVETLIKTRLENKQLIYGFGHAVLRVEDPRASIFYEFAGRHFPNNALVKMALKLRAAGSKVLGQSPKITNPYPNVDAISGALLSAAGFPYPDYFTLLFALSRVLGISSQIVYERLEARDGKGVPIYRPSDVYISRKPHDRSEVE